jgi:NADPH2:quinone reductase
LERADDILGLVGDGRLDVRIGGRYPLDQAAQAHIDLQARRTTGKLLLKP